MRGYTVTFCRNGREALEYYEQHAAEIDLVISDVVMPEMNGGELLTKLRSADPDAKIMLMSGYCTETTAAALLEKGAAAFVPKPFTLDDFWERVEAAMGCESRSA
jgi:two-component system cell cycle sensor histidine kinase/response regulator CckA